MWPPGPAPPAPRSAPGSGCGRLPGSAGAAGTGGSGWGAVRPGRPAPSSSAASWAPPAGQPPGPGCSQTAQRCEARAPGTGRLPRGSAAGRGWVAARAGPEDEARAAGPGSPSGGPRGSRAALGGRPERALAAGRRRRSWRGEAWDSADDGKRASRGSGGGCCCWEIRSKDHDSGEAAQQQIAGAAAASVVSRGPAPGPPTSPRRPCQNASARPRPRPPPPRPARHKQAACCSRAQRAHVAQARPTGSSG